MKQCILHIGMPKTGASSIQETLHKSMSDPAFRYIGFEVANCSTAMATLFSDSPKNHHSHMRMGRSAQEVEKYRMQLINQLDKSLANPDASWQKPHTAS